MGPGAGVHGGNIVAEGTPARAHGEPRVDHRAVALRQEAAPDPDQAQEARRHGPSASSGARAHNLQQRHRRDPDRPHHLRHRRVRLAASRASSSTRSSPRRARRSTARPAPVGACDAHRGARAHRQGRSRSIRPPSAARRARTRRRTPASSRSCASSTRACPRRARAATRPAASRST